MDALFYERWRGRSREGKHTMNTYIVRQTETGKPVGKLGFSSNGTPMPMDCGSRGSEIMAFLLQLANVWLPRNKQRIAVDWSNPEHQEAAAQSLGPLGLMTEPVAKLAGNSADWEEEEHPRDKYGKFASKDELPSFQSSTRSSYESLEGNQVYLGTNNHNPVLVEVVDADYSEDGTCVQVKVLAKTPKGESVEHYSTTDQFYTREEYAAAEKAGKFLARRGPEFGEMFAAPFGDGFCPGSARVQYKEEICRELAYAIKAPNLVVRDAIHAWAESANDHLMRSLYLQKEAANITGGSLTEWQQQSFNKLSKKREEAIKLGVVATENPTWLPFEYDSDTLKKNKLDPKETSRRFLESVYRNTQWTLERDNVETVTLYRGCRVPMPKKLQAGNRVMLEMNSLSSWSSSKSTARAFCSASDSGNETSVLLKTVVPRKQVFSTAATGFGCLNEKEFVLHNGGLPDRLLGCEVIYMR